jgi:tRNA(Leu) C34 or U34 (ribose-2'-O)-methylase TrmL
MIITDGVGADLAVALINPKYPHNVGAAVRAASCFSVPQVWFTGNRVQFFNGPGKRKARLPREERMRGYREVDICQGDHFFEAFPRGVTPVAVDLLPGAESLIDFDHPERAVYVFGPEDGGLGRMHLGLCHRFVRIPMRHCANLASAVYMVLMDRHFKRVRLGLDEPYQVADERGWAEPDSMSETVGVQ